MRGHALHCTSGLGIGIEMWDSTAKLVSHACSALQGLLRKLGVEDMMPGVMGMGSSQVKVRVGAALCKAKLCEHVGYLHSVLSCAEVQAFLPSHLTQHRALSRAYVRLTMRFSSLAPLPSSASSFPSPRRTRSPPFP